MARRRILNWRTAAAAPASESTAPSELAEVVDTDSEEPSADLPKNSSTDSRIDESLVNADFEEVDLDAEIAQLYADDSEALARWKDRLSSYVDLQGTLDALRLRPSSEQPWPAFDNPMLGYLKERGAEIAARDGIDAAITWLAANCWFEGAIAERSRFIRLLDAD